MFECQNDQYADDMADSNTVILGMVLLALLAEAHGQLMYRRSHRLLQQILNGIPY
jgi:hypothetical protein